MGRSGILSVQSSGLLVAQANFSFNSFSWSSFRLDHYFDPLIVVSVARTSSVVSNGKISFDRVLVNIGTAWNILTNNFVAPIFGQYFFSLSSAMSDGVKSEFDFNVNGHSKQAFQTGSTKLMSPGSKDLLSVSSFLQLNAGDEVMISVSFQGGQFVYADSNTYQLSLAGLLYSPPISKKVSFVQFFKKQSA